MVSVALALCGLVVCAVPMLVIALAIRMDSKGPALFKQRRLGRGMRPFTVYKFRTMCVNAFEKGGIANSSRDPRITRVGAFLRRTSLDELPQMFNILNGSMAIIGPRPILDFEFEPYKNNPRFCKRYNALPGMFCTVDVINRAAYREEQMEYDAQYVENMSLSLDVKTFIGVIAPVLTGRGVYKDEHDEVAKKV